jgi:hypothetical protein
VSRRVLAPAAAVTAVVLVVVGVLLWRHHEDRKDPFAAYCDEVAQQRGLIATATQQGPTTGLIAALPSFEALEARAPSDVADDWRTVITAIQGLADALRAAGTDPASYDRDRPPAGMTRQQRGAIDAAATRLGSQETRDALASVDQEARDVCHSPLLL